MLKLELVTNLLVPLATKEIVSKDPLTLHKGVDHISYTVHTLSCALVFLLFFFFFFPYKKVEKKEKIIIEKFLDGEKQ